MRDIESVVGQAGHVQRRLTLVAPLQITFALRHGVGRKLEPKPPLVKVPTPGRTDRDRSEPVAAHLRERAMLHGGYGAFYRERRAVMPE